jgi:hypothetical protein
MTTAAPAVGDTEFLANYLINTKVYAVVVPPGGDQEFVATFEVQGDQGTLTMAAIIGPRGANGMDMFILHLQTDNIDDPGELPKTLEDSLADLGKFWVFDDVDSAGVVIGSSGYIWYGDSYRRIMLGTPGAPGPIPIITPTVELVAPGTGSSIIPGGTDLYPTWHLLLDPNEGPQGPGAAIAVAPDVDLSAPPVAGDVLGFTGRYTDDEFAYPIWVPVSISQLIPSPYSMPENAFTSFSGLSQRAAIGSFQLPAQPFPWTPIIWGHIGVFGLELSTNPMMIGCEVLLGDPQTGAQIGRGFGNTLGEVNIMPQYSTPATPTDAITPSNGRAVIPPNHANPSQATIYVNLYNDGAAGIYSFNPIDAQIFVLVVPVAPVTAGVSSALITTRRG